MSFEAAVHAKAIQLDHFSLDMCAAAGSGHPSSAMSLGHIVTVLMYHSMRWLPDHPGYPTSDRLVLSEGHAVPIIYAALADLDKALFIITAIVNFTGFAYHNSIQIRFARFGHSKTFNKFNLSLPGRNSTKVTYH